jgi:signal transduction histidine kinase
MGCGTRITRSWPLPRPDDAHDEATMIVIRERADLLARLRRPKTTVRSRLTLLYGGLFLACGAALLAITYALVAHASITPGRSDRVVFPPAIQALLHPEQVRSAIPTVQATQRIADLHQLVIESAVALGAMAIVSAILGWVVAGRVLRPLRTITATTQQISETNLHRRLAMAGPRDELTQLADTIDGLLARMETAFEAQRRFVANASHELRTPLTTMRTTLDVAIAKPAGVPPQVTELDADLREDLDEADRLLESFLTLARAQQGELGETSLISLQSIITAALATRASELADKQIEIRAATAPVCVTGSEKLLERMVENVIENAIRHNQPHGFIELACTLDAGRAVLIVENGGPILDEGSVAALAQPFRRLGAERTYSPHGHGLGLSIVAAIAAAHSGTLELHPRPQGGLRVQLTVPGASLATPTGALR